MGSEEGRRIRRASRRDGEVMAAVDQSGVVSTLIIADISTDDAWLAMPADEAPSLTTWR